MKRFLCALLVTGLLFLFAACGGDLRHTVVASPTATPTASSAATTSRDARSAPVAVSETYAKADVVEKTAGPTSTATPIDTPATADSSPVYFAGVLGLILLCSAGLLMLKRI